MDEKIPNLTPVPEPTKGRIYNFVIVGILVAIILAVGFGYYFWKTTKIFRDAKEKDLVEILFGKEKNLLETLAEKPEVTSDWQTYRNEEYGFEFKYPNSLKIDLINSPLRLLNLIDGTKEYSHSSVSLFIQKSNFELKDAYKDSFAYNYEPSSLMQVFQENIGNNNFLVVYYCIYGEHNPDDPNDDCVRSLTGNKDHIIIEKLVKHNDSIIIFNSIAGKHLDQILSTFKFIDKKPVSVTKTGTLTGHATVGPICPVEREGEPCPVLPEAYTSRYIIVYKSDGKTEVTRKYFDADGDYNLELPTEMYIVKTLSGINSYTSNTVTIEASKATTLNFDIDTGIR